MDENATSFSPSYSQSESPKIYINKPAGSGLTLVIPSLKSLKAQKSAKDPKPRSSSHGPVFQDVDNQEKRIPRPIKLKPLKEVLSKLIVQIKKKDDYAFFLHPVDVANVPGYSDVVKHPMDLGTMTEKVARGKYRSLEDFASDLKLVTNNAKLFNPPGSIYYTEADRLETWALDHIGRAASTVIQYETDWNIEIEKDDEGPPVNVEDDEDFAMGTPMEVDTTSLRERSVSILSQPQPGPSVNTRRGPRGPYKKQTQPTSLSETLEADGGLPGSKDGLGAFPPGSDWAKTMVALKLKGKRYKTKKERMRIEREGPPLLAEGSLDYTEMEDPFSVLQFFVPEPPSRPHLVPLYPPLYNPPPDPSSSSTPYTPHPPTQASTFPSATTLPLNHQPPSLPFLQPPSDDTPKQPHRRHWNVVRNATWRQKGKEREDDVDGTKTADVPPWRMPREAQTTDFGSFAVLAGELAEEMRRRGMATSAEKETVDHEATALLIKERLDCESVAKNLPAESVGANANVDMAHVSSADLVSKGYWTNQRAAEAEAYLRDVVYGGLEGLAYVRSLAQFVDGDCYYKEDEDASSPLPEAEEKSEPSGLGMPLAKWVEENIIDPLTEGRHSLLNETARELARQQKTLSQPLTGDPRNGTVAGQVAASLHLYPNTLIALSALLHIRLHKIDMGALIKVPDELFLSEEEWVGKKFKEKRRKEAMAKLEAETTAKRAAENGMQVDEPPKFAGLDPTALKERLSGRLSSAYEQEGPAELNEVLEYVANAIIELDRKNREKTSSTAPNGNGAHTSSALADALITGQAQPESVPVKVEDYATSASTPISPDQEQQQQSIPADAGAGAGADGAPTVAEDPALRNLRLNLLALAKRAPLDTIARLPKDLVPEHIRHFVPTLGSTTG
ncbi:hypothetical protein BDN70DRAFT_872410 [Pholiota conissans]|uniref:Bromo domain-containing protein n=1 Tax=Pholiota conissans TaxID=109636 RepID=A0A9P6CXY6_9AGAR|nr:hypothetical protein BDN70DRAFT_872410 [Pholiota conissans]